MRILYRIVRFDMENFNMNHKCKLHTEIGFWKTKHWFRTRRKTGENEMETHSIPGVFHHQKKVTESLWNFV